MSAFSDNKKVFVKLGLLGWKSTQDFFEIDISDSLLNFKYTMLGLEESSESSFTFDLDILNPVEELESVIRAIYSHMFASVKGSKDKLATTPKMLIQWGYGDVSEGKSKIHVAQISDVKYKFNDKREKVLSITGKSIIEHSRVLSKNSIQKRRTALIGGVSGTDRDILDITLDLLSQALESLMDVKVLTVENKEYAKYINTLIGTIVGWGEGYSITTRVPVYTGYNNIRLYEDVKVEATPEGLKKDARESILRFLGFSVQSVREDSRYYLIRVSNTVGIGGFSTQVVAKDQLSEEAVVKANSLTSAATSLLFKKSIKDLEDANSLDPTELIYDTDFIDLEIRYGIPKGTKFRLLSSYYDMKNSPATSTNPKPGQQFVIEVPDGFIGYGFSKETRFLTTDSGRAKINASLGEISKTLATANTFGVEVNNVLTQSTLLDLNQTAQLSKIYEVDFSALKNDKQAFKDYFGIFPTDEMEYRDLSLVEFDCPKGATAFGECEKVLKKLSSLGPDQLEDYRLWTIPSSHTDKRSWGFAEYAKYLIDDKVESEKIFIATYRDYISMFSPGSNVFPGKGFDMQISSFPELNVPKIATTFSKNPSQSDPLLDYTKYSKLSYGDPTSIVKFFDFTGEAWYLWHQILGAKMTIQIKDNFELYNRERIGTAFWNFGEKLETQQTKATDGFGSNAITEEQRKNYRDINKRRVILGRVGDHPGSRPSEITITEEELSNLKDLLKWIRGSSFAGDAFASLSARDQATIDAFVSFLNEDYGVNIFFTKKILNSHTWLSDAVKISFGDVLGGVVEKQNNTITTESLYTFAKTTPFDAYSKKDFKNILVNSLIASNHLNMRYAFQIRLKLLGVPEYDTVREINERRTLFTVTDTQKERFRGEPVTPHWLSGLYRTIGVSHTINPKVGYITELKLFRDPTAAQSGLNSLISSISNAALTSTQ